MKLAVVGTGYVGLVAGTCFADYGNEVYCVDIDENKINKLKQGIPPIYEPGLEEMIVRNHKNGRLKFTTDIKDAIEKAQIVFIAVGTPGKEDGRPNISGVLKVAEEIGKYANEPKIIVNKSTVPVGMADLVIEATKKQKSKYDCTVVSNPEFLREGHAIEDFMKPERVVLGVDSDGAAETMRKLYSPFVEDPNSQILIMSIKSAELTKYACNTFLAMKVTFANIVANLCDTLGANYSDVKKGMATDTRIGNKFLNAGIGYGGSCFPKDVRALVQIAGDAGVDLPLINEVENYNNAQKIHLETIIKRHYADKKGNLTGLNFAVWGLSFKPSTDDMREAPAISLLHHLAKQGVKISAHDPVAIEASRPHLETILEYGEMYDILEGKDALLILTEWHDYREPDFDRIAKLLKKPLIFDGRNIYDPKEMTQKGIRYYGIGIKNEG